MTTRLTNSYGVNAFATTGIITDLESVPRSDYDGHPFKISLGLIDWIGSRNCHAIECLASNGIKRTLNEMLEEFLGVRVVAVAFMQTRAWVYTEDNRLIRFKHDGQIIARLQDEGKAGEAIGKTFSMFKVEPSARLGVVVNTWDERPSSNYPTRGPEGRFVTMRRLGCRMP